MAKRSKHIRKYIDKDTAFAIYSTKVNGRYPTLEEVAAILGYHPISIERVSMREKWVERREKIRKDAIEKFKEETQDIAKAEQYKEFDDWCLVEDVITDALRMMRERQKEALTATDPALKLIAMKSLKQISYDMNNLANALRMAKNGKRTLLGLATDITKGEILHETKTNMSLHELQEMADFISKNTAKDKDDSTTPPTST